MKRGFDRTQRVSDVIQKALAPMLLEASKDSNFITVTGVTVSRDLSYAKIYVSVLSDDIEKITETVKGLNQSAKKIRHELAHQVDLRIIPELKFLYDESTVHGFRISSLINSAIKKSDKNKK